jgi:hypothetical protein
LKRGGFANRLSGSFVPGILQSAAESNGLLKVKFLEGSKAGGFLKAVDGRGSDINARIIEPAGRLQVEPVGALAHQVDLLTGIGPRGARIPESLTNPMVFSMLSIVERLRFRRCGEVLDGILGNLAEFG